MPGAPTSSDGTPRRELVLDGGVTFETQHGGYTQRWSGAAASLKKVKSCGHRLLL